MTSDPEHIQAIRNGVHNLGHRYDEQYRLTLDSQRDYPTEFVRTLTDEGYFSALIPEEYGGSGFGLQEVYGGFAFAREYHIERKFCEIRLYRTASISTNFILGFVAEHVLGLPRNY